MDKSQPIKPGLRVALEGCGHGRLRDIYASVEESAKTQGWDGVDLLIIGGDFQAVRNSNDMTCMSVPDKYKEIGDFHEYYSGVRIAPCLTIFVGGNHEASNHLFELYYGGWVAPNIYYMGAANVIRCGPLRIAGMSGIWKGYDYKKPHFERLPYNRDDIQSLYHIREVDVRKILQVRTQVDIGISHDWPRGAELTGDKNRLFRIKRDFQRDSIDGKLGSLAAKHALDHLRPAFWFSAHLHVKYTGTIRRKAVQNNQDVAINHTENKIDGKADKTPAVGARSERSTASAVSAWNNFHETARKVEAEETAHLLKERENADKEQSESGMKPTADMSFDVTWRKIGEKENGGGRQVTAVKKTILETAVKNEDEINLDDLDLDSSSEGAPETSQALQEAVHATEHETQTLKSVPETKELEEGKGRKSSEEATTDLRALLPASFARPEVAAVEDEETVPMDIKNMVTDFMALDKCLPRRDFMQLLEIPPISDDRAPEETRPFRLHYDKEWLAITRAMADELVLGDRSSRVPESKGSSHYKTAIHDAEAWIDENVVKAGKMAIPENFVITAPVYDPAIPVTTKQMPIEYTNPQTSQFCDLVGIENKFDATDEERHARFEAGPRPEAPRFDNRHGRGGHGRGGRGGRGARGGRGGRGGGGRGQGNHRGRNVGFW